MASTGNFFLDISPTDISGTPIIYYSWFNDDTLTSILMGVLAIPTLLCAKIVTILGTYLVSLYSDPNIILGPIAWFIDSILGKLFSIISLPAIILLAITVFIARQLLSITAEDGGDKGRNRWKSKVDISNIFAPKSNGGSGLQLGESAYKNLKDGFVHILLSVTIIFFLLSNPMGMLAKVTEFIQRTVQTVFSNGTIGNGEDPYTLSQFIARILAIFVSTMNFSNYDTSDTCMDAWSSANQDSTGANNIIGGGIAGIRNSEQVPSDCFSGVEPFMTIIGGVLILLAMIVISAFFIVMASRAVLFLWNMSVIMFRLVLDIFRGLFVPTPETDTLKSKVDKIVDSVWDFGVFLAYYLLILLMTYAIPIGIISGLQYLGLNQVLAIILATIAMGVAAFALWGFSPTSNMLRNPGSYQLSWENIAQAGRNLAKGEIHNGDKITRLRRDDGSFAVGEFIMASPLGNNIATFKNDMGNLRETTMRTIAGDNYDTYQENKEKLKEKTKRFLKIEDRKMQDLTGVCHADSAKTASPTSTTVNNAPKNNSNNSQTTTAPQQKRNAKNSKTKSKHSTPKSTQPKSPTTTSQSTLHYATSQPTNP